MYASLFLGQPQFSLYLFLNPSASSPPSCLGPSRKLMDDWIPQRVMHYPPILFFSSISSPNSLNYKWQLVASFCQNILLIRVHVGSGVISFLIDGGVLNGRRTITARPG